VQDRRPYVRNAEKKEDFVGLMRGGFGNPWDITTDSKQPMAIDLRGAMAAALTKRGFQVTPLAIPVAHNAVQAQEAATAARRDRALLLMVDELKSDTYANIKFGYDFKLTVYDSTGKALAETDVSGTDTLGSATVPGDVRRAVLPALQAKLEALLNDPKVIAALQ